MDRRARQRQLMAVLERPKDRDGSRSPPPWTRSLLCSTSH
jgi:hypothetical protein